MADFEYSVTPIPLAAAGEMVLALEGSFLNFIAAQDAAGIPSLDAKLEIAIGRSVDDFVPFFPNNQVEGYFPQVKFRWTAQPGLTALIFVSRGRAADDEAKPLKIVAPPAKQLVTSALATLFTSSAVTVGTAAVIVAAAAAGRQAVTIYNNGSADIFIGGSGVTTANGLRVGPGGAYSTDRCTGALYAISTAAGQNVRVLEES